MSSINGISGYMSNAYAQGLASSQGNRGRGDLFKKIDSDGSGGVSKTELDAFASKMSKMTGATINTDDAIATYDKDRDGELSSTELKGLLDAYKPSGPPMGMMGMGMPPGPSPEEKFSEADSDRSGGLNATELDALVTGISEATGMEIDTTDAISTYDKDGDGELSGDEVRSFLDASGLTPPPPPKAAFSGTDETSTDSLIGSLTDNTISTYDSDGDGSLSNTELKSFLTNSISKLSADYIVKALSAYTGAYGPGSSSSVSLDA